MTEHEFFRSYPPEIVQLYARFCAILKSIGPFRAEVKRTSIHLVNTKGFAGVHPKKSYLGINLVLSRSKTDPSADKVEQVSKNRFHHFFQIRSTGEMGRGFRKLVKEAYLLMEN